MSKDPSTYSLIFMLSQLRDDLAEIITELATRSSHEADMEAAQKQ